MDESTIKHVFIIGSKGIPAQYGGYETFVEKLTRFKTADNIKYHVACAVDDIEKSPEKFVHNNAECFNIEWKKVGSAKAIFYDIDALKYSVEYIKKNNIKSPIIYVLACRIGPFFNHYVKIIHKLGGKIYVNPDGHEWMRSKWSYPVRTYWKISEKLMAHHADLLVCDSKNIESYIHDEYDKYSPNTTFIAYGAEIKKSTLQDNSQQLNDFYNKHALKINDYYLIVGRFVPENNYQTMISEFMSSSTKKDLAIITKTDDKFFKELEDKTAFSKDKRIKFVGTVYESELLKKIRENAFAYFHGHEVGGTNPSLLEALSSTKLNLLLDVGFNREVGEVAAIYWNKQKGSLCSVIESAEKLSDDEINEYDRKSTKRIEKAYSWQFIVSEYENLFLSEQNKNSVVGNLYELKSNI